MPLIAPSILAADWARLGEALDVIEAAGASIVHVDVMDGHFVPAISVGQPVVASLRKATELPIEVHLLVERPERFVGDFLKAGADRVCVHCEATHQLSGILDAIRSHGAKAGVAVLDTTPLEAICESLGEIDFLTVLGRRAQSKNGAVAFGSPAVQKISKAAALRANRRLSFEIQIEGSIDARNLDKVAAAGADILIVGSDIFNKEDPQTHLTEMVRAARRIPGTLMA
jgi:ribulose-phosphate 3-epimerase